MPFYHFTDVRNVASIKKYGLLSWYQLNRRNIVHYPASDALSRELDVQKNLQHYVSLTNQQDHPMVRVAEKNRGVKLTWLEIDEACCEGNSSVLYSDMNATDNLATINDDPSTALTSTDWQAEILVKNFIDPRWITKHKALPPLTW